MKKNLVFKLGLFCAALVLVATCFVTNAWAKYTTTVYATDTARVAKFEVWASDGDENFTKTPLQIDVFTTKMNHIYKDANDENVYNKEKLIAPGSKGGFTFTIGNNSQVDVAFTVDVQEANVNIPLTWTVSVDGGTKHTGNNLKDLFTAHVADFTLAATDGQLGHGNTKSIKIEWEWKFYDSDERDEQDTALGVAPTTYKLDFEVTATQVDPNL